MDRVTLDFMRAGREPEGCTGGLRSLRYPVIKRLAATSSPCESRALAELMERVRTILLADDGFEARR